MYALGLLGVTMAFLILEQFSSVERNIRSAARDKTAARTYTPQLKGHRRAGIIHACIAIAPLLGLLGTVSGMVDTFSDILTGGYLLEMSGGIGQALRTTQYGLAIAVPGLLAETILARRRKRLQEVLHINSSSGCGELS